MSGAVSERDVRSIVWGEREFYVHARMARTSGDHVTYVHFRVLWENNSAVRLYVMNEVENRLCDRKLGRIERSQQGEWHCSMLEDRCLAFYMPASVVLRALAAMLGLDAVDDAGMLFPA